MSLYCATCYVFIALCNSPKVIITAHFYVPKYGASRHFLRQ